jgi:hypothetical protein
MTSGGAGYNYVRKMAIEAAKAQLAKLTVGTAAINTQDCCQPASLDPTGTVATFADGTSQTVTPQGLPGSYNVICQGVNTYPEPQQFMLDGSKKKGYLLARTGTLDGTLDPTFGTVGSCLYVKPLGSSLLYQLPQILPSFIPPSQYQGVFSNNGNNLLVFSASYNPISGDNYLYYSVFPTFQTTTQDPNQPNYVYQYTSYVNADGTTTQNGVSQTWAATASSYVTAPGLALQSYNMTNTIREVSVVPKQGEQYADSIYQAFQNQDQSNFERFNPIVTEQIDYYGEGSGNSQSYPFFFESQTLGGNDLDTVSWQADTNNQLMFSDFAVNLGDDLTVQVLAGGVNTAIYYIDSENFQCVLTNTDDSFAFCEGCPEDVTSTQTSVGNFSYIYNFDYFYPKYSWTVNGPANPNNASVQINGLWDSLKKINGYITLTTESDTQIGSISNPDGCGADSGVPPGYYIEETINPGLTFLLVAEGDAYPDVAQTSLPGFISKSPFAGCNGGVGGPQTTYGGGSIGTDQITSVPYTANIDTYFDGTVNNDSPGSLVVFNDQIPAPDIWCSAKDSDGNYLLNLNGCFCGNEPGPLPPNQYFSCINYTTNCDTFLQEGPAANVFAWESAGFLLTQIASGNTIDGTLSPAYGFHYPLTSQIDTLVPSKLFRNQLTTSAGEVQQSFGVVYNVTTQQASGASYGNLTSNTYVNNALANMGLDLATAESLGLTLSDLQDLGGGGGDTSTTLTAYYCLLNNSNYGYNFSTIAVMAQLPDVTSDQLMFPYGTFPYTAKYLKAVSSYQFLGYSTKIVSGNTVDMLTLYNVQNESFPIFSGLTANVTTGKSATGINLTSDLIMDFTIQQ